MQRVSRERQSQIARAVADELGRDGSTRLLKDRETIRQSIIHALTEELRRDEERASSAQKRMIDSDPSLEPGSSEWNAAYERMLIEEYDRHSGEA